MIYFLNVYIKNIQFDNFPLKLSKVAKKIEPVKRHAAKKVPVMSPWRAFVKVDTG